MTTPTPAELATAQELVELIRGTHGTPLPTVEAIAGIIARHVREPITSHTEVTCPRCSEYFSVPIMADPAQVHASELETMLEKCRLAMIGHGNHTNWNCWIKREYIDAMNDARALLARLDAERKSAAGETPDAGRKIIP